MSTDVQIDAFPPAKMAARMEDVGVTKSELNFWTMGTLAVLAGAFIACGAIFSTTVGASTVRLGPPPAAGPAPIAFPFGVTALLEGLVFCLGFVAVVVAGAELFTGNNLIIMAWASGKIKLGALLRSWGISYVGNFIGAILTVVFVFLSKQYAVGNGAVGLNALEIANTKAGLGFGQAIGLGVLANALICLAVWLSSSARSTTDKILAVIFPITAFVAAGFEHSIANMYFIPIGLLIKDFVPADSAFWANIGRTAADFQNLTWSGFIFRNLLPVTIGNIIGGTGFVGLAYWFAYLRPQRVAAPKETKPNILVVDDDPDFVDVMRVILTKEGYEVTTAANGKEAWNLMMQKKPDIVLLDVMMSTTLEGVEVSRKMAADQRLKSVPVIMVSSIDSSWHADKLPSNIHLPVDAWISKPVNPDYLLKTIERFIS